MGDEIVINGETYVRKVKPQTAYEVSESYHRAVVRRFTERGIPVPIWAMPKPALS